MGGQTEPERGDATLTIIGSLPKSPLHFWVARCLAEMEALQPKRHYHALTDGYYYV